jgi:hypothetical protein
MRAISLTPVLVKNKSDFFPLVDGTEGESDSEDSYPGILSVVLFAFFLHLISLTHFCVCSSCPLSRPVLRRPKVRLDAPFDLDMVVSMLRDRKMQDICVIDIAEKVNWYRYFIVATGTMAILVGWEVASDNSFVSLDRVGLLLLLFWCFFVSVLRVLRLAFALLSLFPLHSLLF